MHDKIYIMLGSALVLWGIGICVNPVYYSSRFRVVFDFSEVRLPFGMTLIVIGGFFIWSSIRKK